MSEPGPVSMQAALFIIYFSGLFPYMNIIDKSAKNIKRKVELEHTIEKKNNKNTTVSSACYVD